MRPHIATDTQRLSISLAPLITAEQRPQKTGRGTAYLPRTFFINLVGINASYIVCLENRRIHFVGFLKLRRNKLTELSARVPITQLPIRHILYTLIPQNVNNECKGWWNGPIRR
jgi:hypothetical protein